MYVYNYELKSLILEYYFRLDRGRSPIPYSKPSQMVANIRVMLAFSKQRRLTSVLPQP